MLSSISPLGERSRGTSFTRTAVAYVVGSTLSAMAAGSVLGGIGSLVPDEIRGSAPVLAALAAMFVVGLVLDVRSGGHGVPSWRRQVDREWIGRYRGWVTGLGFGLQLGLGFVTISTSTSTSTYAVLVAELLTGHWWAGALIGFVFGLVRAMPLALVRGVDAPQQLHEVFANLDTWAAAADRLARYVPGRSAGQWFFTEGGHGFCLYAVTGAHSRRMVIVPTISRVVRSIRVGPSGSVGGVG